MEQLTGRELDWAIQDEVMPDCACDFEKRPEDQEEYSGYIYWRCKRCQAERAGTNYCEGRRGRWLPQYSTDMTRAWQVVQRLKETLRFSGRQRFLQILQEVVTPEELQGKLIAWPDVFWFTTPEAICQAALQVVRERTFEK
jgi:hypothetical protein